MLFITKENLSEHLRVHTDVKRFVCEDQISFSQKHPLKFYFRIHSNEKLFVVDVMSCKIYERNKILRIVFGSSHLYWGDISVLFVRGAFKF